MLRYIGRRRHAHHIRVASGAIFRVDLVAVGVSFSSRRNAGTVHCDFRKAAEPSKPRDRETGFRIGRFQPRDGNYLSGSPVAMLADTLISHHSSRISFTSLTYLTRDDDFLVSQRTRERLCVCLSFPLYTVGKKALRSFLRILRFLDRNEPSDIN